MTKTEITFLVGYTDLSSFSRAFKKWTGTTFSLYKKGLKSTRQLLNYFRSVNGDRVLKRSVFMTLSDMD